MCLAIPAKVLEVEVDRAKVDYGGVVREVNISLIEKPQPGEYVVVHAGYAIQVMDAAEAEETLDLFRQILEFEDGGDERIDA